MAIHVQLDRREGGGRGKEERPGADRRRGEREGGERCEEERETGGASSLSLRCDCTLQCNPSDVQAAVALPDC